MRITAFSSANNYATQKKQSFKGSEMKLTKELVDILPEKNTKEFLGKVFKRVDNPSLDNWYYVKYGILKNEKNNTFRVTAQTDYHPIRLDGRSKECAIPPTIESFTKAMDEADNDLKSQINKR